MTCQESLYSSAGEHGFSRHRAWRFLNRLKRLCDGVHPGEVLRSSRSVFTIRTDGSCRWNMMKHDETTWEPRMKHDESIESASDAPHCHIVLRSMQPLYRWQDPDMQAAMLNELRTVPEAGKQRCISCRINYDLYNCREATLFWGRFYHQKIQLAAWCFWGALINDQQAGGWVQDGATSRGWVCLPIGWGARFQVWWNAYKLINALYTSPSSPISKIALFVFSTPRRSRSEVQVLQ